MNFPQSFLSFYQNDLPFPPLVALLRVNPFVSAKKTLLSPSVVSLSSNHQLVCELDIRVTSRDIEFFSPPLISVKVVALWVPIPSLRLIYSKLCAQFLPLPPVIRPSYFHAQK